jgi:hypothetical protein
VLACHRERLLVALADLLGLHALLQAVVARDEQVVNPPACFGLVDLRKLAVWGHRG